ncbi:Cytochrome P450 CYP65BH1 [Metarhizium brunneum]
MSPIQSISSAIANSLTLQLVVIAALILAVRSSRFCGNVVIANGRMKYPIGSIVHNIYFHPLSKFPGPKSWAATYLPYIRGIFTCNLVQSFAEIHQKYGDVVRVGPNEISIASEEAWREIYGHRPGHKEALKDTTWYIAPSGAPQNVFTTADPAVRARMRRCLSSSFTQSAIRNQSSIIEGYADLLIIRLREKASAPDSAQKGAVVNMGDWISFFTFDVIGDLALGETFGCLQNGQYHAWVRSLCTFLKGMTFAGVARIYPWVGSFVERFLIPRSVMDQQKQHVEFVSERVNRRLNLETTRPDFMTSFLKDNRDFENMSRGEIESNFAILIIAGSDTTTITMCGTLHCLTRNTDKLAILEDTIRTRFQSEKDITVDGTKDIPYLDAVIEEGLRLCPAIPALLPRVVPAGGETYSGHYLPGGTKISVRPAILHTSARYFEAPHEFHPERWLPADQRPGQFASDNHAASRPFSVGPTGCAGKGLAWAELRLIIARLVWAFDMSVDSDHALDWTKWKARIVVEKGPQFLRLKQRPL